MSILDLSNNFSSNIVAKFEAWTAHVQEINHDLNNARVIMFRSGHNPSNITYNPQIHQRFCPATYWTKMVQNPNWGLIPKNHEVNFDPNIFALVQPSAATRRHRLDETHPCFGASRHPHKEGVIHFISYFRNIQLIELKHKNYSPKSAIFVYVNKLYGSMQLGLHIGDSLLYTFI